MLFAVLVSSVLLSIGIFILNISKKEVILSSIGRESVIAFYAADGGVECAHYWDAHGDAFGLKANGDKNIDDSPFFSGKIQCGGVSGGIAVSITPATLPSTSPFDLVSIFSINTGTHCADVKITKVYKIVPGSAGPPPVADTYVLDDAVGVIPTTIDSRGYNTCDSADPRRVERGLRETLE